MKKPTHAESGSHFNFWRVSKCGFFGKRITFADKGTQPTCKKCLKIMEKGK